MGTLTVRAHMHIWAHKINENSTVRGGPLHFMPRVWQKGGREEGENGERKMGL